MQIKLDRGFDKVPWLFDYIKAKEAALLSCPAGWYHQTVKGNTYRLLWHDEAMRFILMRRLSLRRWEPAYNQVRPKSVVTPKGRWRWSKPKPF